MSLFFSVLPMNNLHWETWLVMCMPGFADPGGSPSPTEYFPHTQYLNPRHWDGIQVLLPLEPTLVGNKLKLLHKYHNVRRYPS